MKKEKQRPISPVISKIEKINKNNINLEKKPISKKPLTTQKKAFLLKKKAKEILEASRIALQEK